MSRESFNDEEFVGCFTQPQEVVSEVTLAEVGGVAVDNCTGFGERSWDTTVTEPNIMRWQTATDNCPARPNAYCNHCDLQTILDEIKVNFSNSQK